MREDEILTILRRIVRDFSPMMPGVRLEVVSPEAFRARLRGRPILPGEGLGDGETPGAGEPLLYPLQAFPATRVVMVDIEGMLALIGGEDRRLQRVLAEGMILREVIHLATSHQPLPDPRGRAERIFRRHWPFQYTAMRSAGLMADSPLQPKDWTELAGEN